MIALAMLSPTVVDTMVRAWKKARLSRDVEALGFPTISVIGKVVELGPEAVASSRGQRSAPATVNISDAERVQSLVTQMPVDVRRVFEAYHLALVNGELHVGESHKRRARLLNMPYSTYKYRVNSGWRFLQEWLRV